MQDKITQNHIVQQDNKTTSKHRVNLALSHQQADRVPIDFWADGIVKKRMMSRMGFTELEELLNYLNVDFRFIEGTIYTGPELKLGEDGSKADIWGVMRKQVQVDENDPEKGVYEHVVHHPLAQCETIKDIENYKGWPSPDWFDYSKITEMADSFANYSVICGGDRLNRTAQLKPSMYLRGVEQAMLDLALNSGIVEAIIDKIVSFFLEYNKRIFENAKGKIDIFFMGDDFGTQNGPIMSVDMWRKYYRKGFKSYIDLAHKYGIKVMHHTCGAIMELIPDFIDCGLDILQSLQPRAEGMDFEKIKKEYGRDLCFQGGIDIQRTMPYGTPEDIENEVKNIMRIMGPGGGYIFCTAHNIQADTPVENAFALYEAAIKYCS